MCWRSNKNVTFVFSPLNIELIWTESQYNQFEVQAAVWGWWSWLGLLETVNYILPLYDTTDRTCNFGVNGSAFHHGCAVIQQSSRAVATRWTRVYIPTPQNKHVTFIAGTYYICFSHAKTVRTTSEATGDQGAVNGTANQCGLYMFTSRIWTFVQQLQY